MTTSPVKEPYDNPLKGIRKVLGVTIATAASATGLSKNAIMGYEAGMYTNPSPKYTDYLLDHTNRHKLDKDINENTLLAAYAKWRKVMRLTNDNILQREFPLDVYLSGYYTHMHPLTFWRGFSGAEVDGIHIPLPLTTLCKAMCVQQSNLSSWEKNPERWKDVPDVFLSALADAGYPLSTRMKFVQAWKYYSDKRASESRAANDLPVGV